MNKGILGIIPLVLLFGFSNCSFSQDKDEFLNSITDISVPPSPKIIKSETPESGMPSGIKTESTVPHKARNSGTQKNKKQSNNLPRPSIKHFAE